MVGKIFRAGISFLLILVILLSAPLCFAADSGAFSLQIANLALSQAQRNAEGAAADSFQKSVSVTCIDTFTRKHLMNDIYEYTLVIRLGPGSYDKIGIHRVIREAAPWVPVKTSKTVTLLHGDATNFDGSFVSQTGFVPDDQSLAVFLASQSVDVWGIDLRWTFVTDDTADFTFMQNWDTAFHLNDIKLGVRFARSFRYLTGNGSGKMLLLGMSRGTQFAVAYADSETQVPASQRDLKGIIPVDMSVVYSPQDTALRDASLTRYYAYQALYDSGVYYMSDGMTQKALAGLALSAPFDPSPVIPGFTNKQAALFATTATYATFPPPVEPPTPYYHYLAGIFDESGMPAGLQFSCFEHVMSTALRMPSYQSIKEYIEGEAMLSGAADVPFDDHLNAVSIPVLFVGSAGGEGYPGPYFLTQIASADKQSLLVSLYPPEYAAVDFGHADLLWADNAEALFWEPLYDWISCH